MISHDAVDEGESDGEGGGSDGERNAEGKGERFVAHRTLVYISNSGRIHLKLQVKTSVSRSTRLDSKNRITWVG
jgi:hypothetical protein